jgi:hypothetical protein
VPWPTGCWPGLVATPAGVQLRCLENLGSRPFGFEVSQVDPGVDDRHRHPVTVHAGVGQGLDPEVGGHVLVAADRRAARADQAALDHRVGEHPDDLGPGGGLRQDGPLAVRVVGQAAPDQIGGLLGGHREADRG